MPREASNLRAALAYAALGLRVFPLRTASKVPLPGSHGFKDATLDPDQIRRWWSVVPVPGVAIATGQESGVLVVDVDPRNGGDETLARYYKEKGPLPRTVTSLTGGGGTHFWFQCNRPFASCSLGPGLDLKADGGYVVAPFSIHPSGGQYQWVSKLQPGNCAFAELPPSWEPEIVSPHVRPLANSPDLFTEGHRATALTSLAGTMQRRAMSRDAILQALLTENSQRCHPPLPEAEVTRIVNSVTKLYPPEAPPIFTPVVHPPAWTPLDLSNLEDRAVGEVSYVIDTLIPRGEITVLAAAMKTGKTLLTYRMVLDAVLGQSAFGQFAVPKKTKTVVFQLEMPYTEDLRRFRKLCLGAGTCPSLIKSAAARGDLRVYNRPMLDLLRPEGMRQFHDAVFSLNPDLVVVDSLLAAFAGAELNDNSVVRRLLDRTFLPLTREGIAVVALHHKKKPVMQTNGGPPPDPRFEMLGAQAFGAAAGRFYLLDRIATPDPGQLHLKLSLAGSWTPEEEADLYFSVEDTTDGAGTRVDVLSLQDQLREGGVNLPQQLAILIASEVQQASQPLPREEVRDAIRETMPCSERSFIRGIAYAVQKEWIATTRVDRLEGRVTLLCKGKISPL